MKKITNGFVFNKPSLTKQEFKKTSDINYIVRKYESGAMPLSDVNNIDNEGVVDLTTLQGEGAVNNQAHLINAYQSLNKKQRAVIGSYDDFCAKLSYALAPPAGVASAPAPTTLPKEKSDAIASIKAGDLPA